MAIAYVTGVTANLGINGGTTSSVDSTGGNLLVVVVAYYDLGTVPTISDSKGNTFTGLTASGTGDGGQRVRIYYATNPTVGSSHTFTATGTTSYAAVSALVFSGANTSSPFDQQNAATGASALSTGSVTPTENDELVVAGAGLDTSASALSINSGFSTPAVVYFAPGSAYGVGSAYKIQTTAAAVNPAWSWTGGGNETAAIATFKVAAAAGGKIPAPLIFGTKAR